MPKAKLVTKVLQYYWRQTRSLTLGTQGMVLDADGRVLLVRHTYRPGWHFPGGGVEKSETVAEALRRELAEEAGIIIEGAPELFGIYTNFRAFPGDHIAFFVIRSWRRPVVPEPNHEIAAHGFFALDRLPEPLNPPVASRLAEVVGGKSRSEQW